ncbi:hypothetical protein EYF80_020832 [Liparis tanakae]|uniref:Uncharacterized protein n=1 Tax=Liparis tanakae TaxID=230148 RepID=A0A4Z2HTU1_9TELE|nr:hypothetical protein EYF80_020832 [Liparis tanakae]
MKTRGRPDEDLMKTLKAAVVRAAVVRAAVVRAAVVRAAVVRAAVVRAFNIRDSSAGLLSGNHVQEGRHLFVPF